MLKFMKLSNFSVHCYFGYDKKVKGWLGMFDVEAGKAGSFINFPSVRPSLKGC